ncbi:MAG: hypothetical protein V4696_05280 [Pseudomonadota bacterium]
MTEDEALWRKRFHMFALLRLSGLAIVFFGMAVMLTDLVQTGGSLWLGGILVAAGVIDAVVAPRILKRSWDKK